MGTPKRQRHKENRQARLEAERAAAARAKRRRQLVTIVAGSLLLFGALAFIAGRGGDDDGTDAASPSTTSPEAPPTTPPPSPVSTIPNGPKPEVTVPEGDLPTELVVEDLGVLVADQHGTTARHVVDEPPLSSGLGRSERVEDPSAGDQPVPPGGDGGRQDRSTRRHDLEVPEVPALRVVGQRVDDGFDGGVSHAAPP